MTLPVPSFFNLAAGNQPLSLLDQQFSAIAATGIIACSAVGQNTLVLTPNPNNFVPTVYTIGAPKFVWVQQSTTVAGPVTINVAGIGVLTAYRANGTIPLGSGDLVAGCLYTAAYDPTLSSGSGGFVVDTLGGTSTTRVSATAPANPNPGDLWWDSVGGLLYFYYQDVNSAQWVNANNYGAGTAGTGDINFPSSPTSGQKFATPSGTFQWDGAKWIPIAPVTSFNTRTGAVVLISADITAAGGALLASPVFTGVPTAPTAAPGTSNLQLATTAFVAAATGVIPPPPITVNVKNFGALGNATYPANAGSLLTSVVANGTNVLVAASANGAPVVGQYIASSNWHSLGAAALPFPTTITAVSGLNITVSQTIASGTYPLLVTWTPINSSTVTGTDDTAAIKSAIDYALQNKLPDVYVPPGVYLISDTLQLGYGDNTYSIHLIGSDRAPYTSSFAGATIISVAADRPAINIQGGRLAEIRGINLVGPSSNFTIWAQTFSFSCSSDPLDYLDPLLTATGSTPGGLQQHTPLAGITIDAFSGASPAAPYPQNFPSWTGLTGTYNRLYSSDTAIRDVFVRGFGVNIASGLNTNTQGDFLRITGGANISSAYGITVGNNQSRSVRIADINFQGHQVCIDTNIMGVQTGMIGGPIENCTMSECYSFIYTSSSASTGPLRIVNCYSEACVRIGTVSAGGSFNSAVVFDGCLFKFQEGSGHGQIPAGYLTTAANMGYTFLNCNIVGNNRINNLCIGNPVGNLTVRNCTFQTAVNGPGGSVPMQTAINYSGGCLPGPHRFNPSQLDTTNYTGNVMMYCSTASNVGSRFFSDDLQFNTTSGNLSRVPMTAVAKGFKDTGGHWWNFQRPSEGSVTMTTITVVTVPPAWSNDVMTFTLAAGQYTGNPALKIQPGFILYHYNSGTIFVVTAVNAVDGSGNYPIVTQQQNNLIVNPSTGAYVSNTLPDAAPGFVNPLAGSTLVIATNIMLPRQVYYGTFTNGSANVAGITRGDTVGTDIATYLAAGDIFTAPIWQDQTVPQYWINSAGLWNSLVSVTAGSPATAVLTGNASQSGRFTLYPFPIR